MSEMTPERLAELRRVAEAATPGPWRLIPGANVFSVVAPETKNQGDPYYRWAIIADTDPCSVDGEQAAANACYIAAFHPPTVLALLGEIERLRQERETLAAGLIDSEECVKVLLDLFPDDVRPGVAGVVDRMGRRRRTALALLDGEKGGDRRE